MDAETRRLRRAVFASLRDQGYTVTDGEIALPADATKDDLRHVHRVATRHKLHLAEPSLRRKESRLISFVAHGHEVKPQAIRPRLVYVEGDSQEELLFRYASLHWSIPVSAGWQAGASS